VSALNGSGGGTPKRARDDYATLPKVEREKERGRAAVTSALNIIALSRYDSYRVTRGAALSDLRH